MKKRASLALVATLALGLLGGTAVAQDRDDWHYGTYTYDSRGYMHYAFDTGFREGQQAGQEDAARRIRFRATDHGAFRSGMDGYRGGNRWAYQDAFRDGYMRGYRQAYGETMERFRHDRWDHHRGDGDWDDR